MRCYLGYYKNELAAALKYARAHTYLYGADANIGLTKLLNEHNQFPLTKIGNEPFFNDEFKDVFPSHLGNNMDVKA